MRVIVPHPIGNGPTRAHCRRLRDRRWSWFGHLGLRPSPHSRRETAPCGIEAIVRRKNDQARMVTQVWHAIRQGSAIGFALNQMLAECGDTCREYYAVA